MVQQFCRGAAFSTYNSNVTQLCGKEKTSDAAAAQKPVDNDNGMDGLALAGLNAAVGRDEISRSK